MGYGVFVLDNTKDSSAGQPQQMLRNVIPTRSVCLKGAASSSHGEDMTFKMALRNATSQSTSRYLTTVFECFSTEGG
jgi:hypothetical protein